MSVDADVLIPDRNQAGQLGLGVQFQVEPRAIFKVDLARRFRLKEMRQVEADAEIGGNERRQMPGLLHLLQLQEAGVDFLCGAGRVAESDQDIAQYRGGDFLRAAVGVDPVDCQTGTAGQYFQLRITHWRSPSGGSKGAAAVRLTSAQYGARVPCSNRPAD